MLRFLLLVVDLLRWLPWWGASLVLAGVALAFWALGRYLVHKLTSDITRAVLDQGKPLDGALATVHAIDAVEPPSEASPLDLPPDDENYDPDLDGVLELDGVGYYWIDVTIAPRESGSTWDPSSLTLVPADFQATEDLEACGEMALLHTLEVWRNGEFARQGARNVTGTTRVRLLLAVPLEVRQVKFSYHFTTFGSLALPAPVALAQA